MKLLLITEFFPQDKRLKFTGGVEARAYYLAHQLKKHHQVTVISRQATAVAATLDSLLKRVLFILTATFKGLFTPADVIEGSNFVSYLPALIVAKLKGIPAIAWYPDVFLGTWQQKFGVVGMFGELVEWLSLKLPWDHIIALSQQTKQKLIEVGINPDKITVVYAGVDLAEFNRVKVKKFFQPTICCISRLVPYKRVGDLIEAFAIIKQSLPSSQLIVIGTGPEEIKLRSLAKSLGVSGSIRWFSGIKRSDLLILIKRSHVFCLPSLVEGFGLVTLEAIAAGVPYVNADIPTNREITQHGKGGLLFTPQSPHDIANKLLKLLTDPKVYSRKVTEGKKLLHRYSWEKSAQETLAIYKSMLS